MTEEQLELGLAPPGEGNPLGLLDMSLIYNLLYGADHAAMVRASDAATAMIREMLERGRGLGSHPLRAVPDADVDHADYVDNLFSTDGEE